MNWNIRPTRKGIFLRCYPPEPSGERTVTHQCPSERLTPADDCVFHVKRRQIFPTKQQVKNVSLGLEQANIPVETQQKKCDVHVNFVKPSFHGWVLPLDHRSSSRMRLSQTAF